MLISDTAIAQHPMVTGELALGSITSRQKLLRFLRSLPAVPAVAETDLLAFIEQFELSGVGIGYVDAHLLAACAQARKRLWTHDKRLAVQAERLGLSYSVT